MAIGPAIGRFSGLYRTVRYPHHDLSKAFIITDLTRVSANRDGTLRIHGARWQETGELEFRNASTSETFRFQEDDKGRIAFLGDSEERVAGYKSGYAALVF